MSIEVKRASGIERLPFDEFEQRVREGEVPPDTQVRFPVLTGSAFVQAGELEFYHALADVEYQAFRRSLRRAGFPIVTALLVGVQLRIYLWAKTPGVSDFLLEHFTNWVPATLENGEVHRILTYGFLHLGFTHLALNLLFLAYTGWNLERGLGRRNLLAVFLFSVFTGGLLSMVVTPGRPSLGASGGDFGLLAASVVFGWKYEELIPKAARAYFNWTVLGYLIVLLLLGLASPSSVDNWGHLGGLLGGAAIATVLQPEAYQKHSSANRIWRRLTLAAALLICLLLVTRGPAFVPLRAAQEDLGVVTSRPLYWTYGWSFTGDQAWLSPVSSAHFVTRTGRDRPISAREAGEQFLLQVQARARDVQVLRRHAVTVDGWPAIRLTLSFRDRNLDLVMEALVIAHGAYVHRIYLHAPAARAARYRLLAEKLFENVEVVDPSELIAALHRAEQNPNSFKSQHEYGRALSLAGYPAEAEDVIVRARHLARGAERRRQASAELLKLFADYAMDRAARIDSIVEDDRESVDVLVEGARAYAALDMPSDAAYLLDEASTLFPGDFLVRSTRRQLGLPGLPDPEAP